MGDRQGPVTLSVVIPILNAERHLARCLQSLQAQISDVGPCEILVVDGGSSDGSLAVSEEEGGRILKNPDGDAQIGKAIGLREARGTYVMFLDADNELVGPGWLSKVIGALEGSSSIMGADAPHLPRDGEPFANRYCTLIDLEDPIARRISRLRRATRRRRLGGIDVLYVPPGRFPIFGANGFIWRKSVLDEVIGQSPSYDEADVSQLVTEAGHRLIADIPGGGIHHHHIDTLRAFIQKRKRNGREYFTRRQRVGRTWFDSVARTERWSALLYCASVVGPLGEGVWNWIRTGERAWLIHPVMTIATVLAYAQAYLAYTWGTDASFSASCHSQALHA